MRFYEALLRLYPQGFRDEYRAELIRTFAERTSHMRGPLGGLQRAATALADVLPSAFATHVDILRQDLLFATRSLRRTPGFATTAILVVALGVGANTAVFSLADFVFLRPLPYHEPEQLVKLWQYTPDGSTNTPSPANEALKEGWELAKQGLRFAVNFLRQNGGVEDESLLSAPTLMIPIAVFSQLKKERLTSDEESALLYWLLVANARGRYSRGSSETFLNEDLTILFRGGSPDDLLEPLKRHLGRLDVLPSDLVGRPARSPLFALSYLALRARGAKDWQTGLGISLIPRGRQHVIQFHHIFPKALLREAGFETAEINEIANLAFISGRTNQRIGKRAPNDYFEEIITKRGLAALEDQLIPTDRELLKVENYRAFLERRRNLLADAINEHLEQSKVAR